jgi:hypothetical protein
MRVFLRRLRADLAICVLIALVAFTHPHLVLDFLALVFGWR